MSDKLSEAQITFAPLPLGGAGEGRSYGKEKSKVLIRAGFQPARDLLLSIEVAAPLP